uniref:Uncharacterized protein n=1 Tax=Arundo donax TaxID=35708 RepID=A0A0A9DM40_ARUDO
MSTSLHGHRNDAMDILGRSELTRARCQTLLYLPLLSACSWSPMLITSALGCGFTAIHLPSLRTCSPATCWSMSRMVSALGSVCAGSPYVRSGAGHLG